MQRVGVLVEIPRVLEEFGIEPGPVLRAAGLHPAQLADAEGFIPFAQAAMLAALSAETTGCDAFSILVGARTRIAHLGPLGRYLASAPDLRCAIDDLILYHPRYVRGGGPYAVDWADGSLLVGYRTHVPSVVGASHIARGAMAFGYSIFKEISGVEPHSVLISLPPPQDPASYKSVFRNSHLVFGAPHFGLVYSEASLRCPLLGADPALRTVLGNSIAARWAIHQPDIRERVLRALVPLTLSGAHSLESTAARLNLTPADLNRELRKQVCSFRDLLNEARFEMACQLIVDARLSIVDITTVLGYSEISAFSRFFASMSGGLPPAEWRRIEHAKDNPAGTPPPQTIPATGTA